MGRRGIQKQGALTEKGKDLATPAVQVLLADPETLVDLAAKSVLRAVKVVRADLASSVAAPVAVLVDRMEWAAPAALANLEVPVALAVRVNLAGPVALADPVAPADPVGPVGPVALADPVAPAGPVVPADLVVTRALADPVVPARLPVAPVLAALVALVGGLVRLRLLLPVGLAPAALALPRLLPAVTDRMQS